MSVPIEKFGKDHWSTFAYIETLCVDSSDGGIGRINKLKMRGNPLTHPLLTGTTRWDPKYGSRLFGFFSFKNYEDPVKAAEAGFQLLEHDDWDCLDDLNDVGLVEIISLANGYVKMTEKGMKVAAKLREHKANGGQFAQFTCIETDGELIYAGFEQPKSLLILDEYGAYFKKG